MLRTVAKRAVQGQELPAALLTQTRQYVAMLSLEFSEDVSTSMKTGRTAPDVASEWAKTKSTTEHTMKRLQTYKDVGDMAHEPMLKFHNPREFEDFSKPVPNFKKFGLKAGEVPKFFDTVLQKRADEAVAAKNAWWESRRTDVDEAASERKSVSFSTLPVPEWKFGKPVPLEQLNKVTDELVSKLEPKRKVQLPVVPEEVTKALTGFTKSIGQGDALKEIEQALTKTLSDKAVVVEDGRSLSDFKFPNISELEAKLDAHRTDVHRRYLKMWAKQILTQPEQALVPLKERDHLLASKWEDHNDKYNDLVDLVSRGPETYGQRLAATGAMDTFALRRLHDEVLAEFPPTDKEVEAAALSAQLDDKGYALQKLLGPAVKPEGSPDRLRSVEARELTEHFYTEDRYMYSEGMKLAERYEQEEKALAEQLKKLTGQEPSAEQLIAAQRKAGSLLTRLAAATSDAQARIKSLEQEKQQWADNPYMQHALTKQQEYLADPSNVAFEEVLYPAMAAELHEVEMKEQDEKARWVEEAEEEELWLLTLLKQSRHIHQHIEFDLPQAAYAHMDPLLYKKLDWEVTHGMDLLHMEAFQGADCEQGEYVKDQMGLENLSHHFLPLLRYRRKKHRALYGKFAPELSAIPVKSTVV